MGSVIAIVLILLIVPALFGAAIFWRFRPRRSGTGRTADPGYALTYLYPGRWFRRE